MKGNVFYFIFVMWHEWWQSSPERFSMSGDDTVEDLTLMATKFEKQVKIMQNQQKQTIPNNRNFTKMIFSLDAPDTLNLIQEQHLANWNLKLLLWWLHLPSKILPQFTITKTLMKSLRVRVDLHWRRSSLLPNHMHKMGSGGISHLFINSGSDGKEDVISLLFSRGIFIDRRCSSNVY